MKIKKYGFNKKNEIKISVVMSILSLIALSYLSSCNNSLKNDYDNIKEYIKGEAIDVKRIDLFKNNMIFFFNQESFQKEMIPVYKYQLKDNTNEYLYSYNDKNSYSYDYEKDAYLVYGSFNGVYDAYYCSYIGEIGYLSSSCSIKLYEESNFLEIEIDNKKNESLNINDYHAIINNEINNMMNEKDELIQTINTQSNQLSLSATYTFYIDLNSFESFDYAIGDSNDSIHKNVVKQDRIGTYASSYFSCFGESNITYILGGKSNVLEVSKFAYGKDEKYLPLSSTINTITINNQLYENTSGHYGEVLIEVSPSFDYEKCICNHLESNYRNLSMSEEDYSKFINQRVIKYSLNNTNYYINTKESVSYSENIGEYGSYIFINVLYH